MNAHPHSIPLAPEAPALCEASGFAQHLLQAATSLVPLFEAGRPIDAAVLRTAMEDAFSASDTSGAWVWKDAYEAAEIAQVLMLSRYGALMQRQAPSPQAFLTMIERLAGLAPSHTRRSEDSIRLQQFSTPLPLAAIVAQAAGFRENDLMLEPSAGTGMLAIFARIAGTRLALNELAETRRALLGQVFPDAVVSGHDAASIDDRLDRPIVPSVIVMNPPFSAANHVEGRFRQATSQHVLSALARLMPGGRLVVITGESFRPSTKTFQSTFQRIGQSADVVFSAAIDGKVFARHGTTIDTRLTVIDKRPAGAGVTAPVESEAAYHPLCATTGDLLSAVLTNCPERSSPPPCPTSTALSVPIRPTRTNLHALRNAARKKTRALAEERAKHPFDDIETAPLDYLPKAWSEPDGALQDTVYEAYDLQAFRIDGAAVHPTALVQSAAMASVPPPMPSYRPLLPKSFVADGHLSAPQLESVIYAGNAHETHLKGWFKRGEIEGPLMAATEGDEAAFRLRKGWFLGDGTGCGKGRQVAGIILDNWLQGRRRAVWVSKSDKLIEDARRDWMALGGRESDIVPLSKFRQGSDIRLPEGILFVTYATLRSAERDGKASRLDQVTSWLGETFDGVIAFDESHAMANAAGEKSDRGDKKASQQGLAGLALQNAVPDARVLYVSATGATVVGNLAYASRLGLWGTGDFPFVTRAEFVAAMEAGGIAAMEMISRDLKALGLYLARSLSYAGVEYEMLVHELTSAQIAIYDSYADAYQIIHNNLEAALQASGISSETGTLNAQAKSAARSAFESNKQRFFNHLITAMKCPSLIRAIEADLAAGHAAVIQVVSTSEAVMERHLEEIPPSEWDDLQVDFTPRENIMDYLMHSFPTQLFEPYTDENGDLRSRPALDGDGNPIICREAERRRDDLIEHLGALAPVQGALDQILWHFGADAVAEVTGRKRRIVKTREGRLKVENRPASSNLGETQAFMDDAKRILIFSDAGGTGRSYHADLGTQNQRLRVHYLLEPGWKADNAIQGLGRTNRTNQAQPPLFRPVATDVKAEKRFLSTIARRLDTLGAITRGQRQTGGQGLFRPEDNLESPYARDALRQLYRRIYRGDLAGCSLGAFEDATGLSLTDENGLKDDLPPITTFLNRLLALTIDMQAVLFAGFEELLDQRIEGAIAAGVYDLGLETLRAESFRVTDVQVIYTHPGSGAETQLLTIAEKRRNTPTSLADALEWLDDPQARLLVNSRSGRAAVQVPATSHMLDDGTIEPRLRLIRPLDASTVPAKVMEDTHWLEADRAAFTAAWTAELAEVPEFSVSTLHIVAGLLLPIWKQLPQDETRVYRLQTDDGQRIIGRRVSPAWVATTLAADAPKLSAAQVHALVLEGKTVVCLSEGMELHRSRVMGANRIELSGFSEAAKDRLKADGFFSEIISWKLRLFCPTDADGVAILDRLLARCPVARLHDRGGC